MKKTKEYILGDIEYLSFDCTPIDEECAQLGHTPDFLTQNILECNVFAKQLKRMFGEELEITLTENQHDLGIYYDLAITYNHETEALVFSIEDNIPTHWDEIAKAELDENDYWPYTRPRPIIIKLHQKTA